MIRFFKKNLLIVLFIFFLLSLILLTYRDYGIAWDEKVFFNGGKYYTKQLLHFLNIKTNLDTTWYEANIVPYPYHEMNHGFVFDIAVFLIGSFFPRFNFEVLHLIRALFAIPIFYLTYWMVKKLLNQWYAALTFIFLILFPRFYPDIFYNAVDIPTVLIFTVAIAYFLYYSETKKTVLKSILFGLILGVMMNQRLLLFYIPILNFIFLFFLQKKNLKMFLLHQFLIFNFSLLTLHLTHPYLLAHPISGLFDILRSARQYPWNAAVLFDGQWFQAGVNPLPWYYLPKSMLITIPPVTLLLFFLGTIGIVTTLFRPRHSGNHQSRPKDNPPLAETIDNWQLTYIVSVFFLPFILVFLLKPTLYDSWRHFMFLTIPMIIIAIYGLQWTVEGGGLRVEKNLSSTFYLRNLLSTFYHLPSLLIILLLILSLSSTAYQMFRLHPYEYLYYNSLVGGLKGAYGKYETDYWGLGYKEAVLWFNKNINDPKKTYRIFVEGDSFASTYYFKSNMKLVTDVNEADYIFTFTRWDFHKRHPGKTIYTVKRENVPLIFIKKL